MFVRADQPGVNSCVQFASKPGHVTNPVSTVETAPAPVRQALGIRSESESHGASPHRLTGRCSVYHPERASDEHRARGSTLNRVVGELTAGMIVPLEIGIP